MSLITDKKKISDLPQYKTVSLKTDFKKQLKSQFTHVLNAV